jgi:DNA polymerase V
VLHPIEIVVGLPTPLPLLRMSVPAGFPSPADDFIEEEIDLQRLLIANRPATFLVRVAGDSMVDKQLFDGDLTVVDRSLPPRDGDVVVVDVDHDRSFKVWCRGPGGGVGLAFANRRFTPYQMPPGAVVEVWGVVTSSINPRRRAHR